MTPFENCATVHGLSLEKFSSTGMYKNNATIIAESVWNYAITVAAQSALKKSLDEALADTIEELRSKPCQST